MMKFLKSQVLFLIMAVVAAMLATDEGGNKNQRQARQQAEPVNIDQRGQEQQELVPQQDREARQVEQERQQAHGLRHTMGGATTKDDATDLGVPMLPGDPNEPQGPEDALGEGPKRGDYRERIGPANYQPHEVRAASPEEVADPARPSVRVVAQRPLADEIGEVPMRKGGVDTADVRNPDNRSR